VNLTEAKAECQRWLDYLEAQKEKATEMGKLAAQRRRGTMTLGEAKVLMQSIDDRMSVRVYDGAKLAEAVKLLIR
jgi:hypothetical protein